MVPKAFLTVRRVIAMAVAGAVVGPWLASASGVTRTQTVELHEGWNAVFLAVTPENRDPDVVFADCPVDIVATYWPVLTPVQFIDDPNEEPWKKPGWGVWYAAARPDAFLTTLGAVFGNKAYLVHATADYLWQVTGTVVCRPPVWQPNSFNLVGFCLDGMTPATFGEFFAGDDAFAGRRFYRLVDDKWVLVTDPDGTPMRDGEAYWVYSRGNSTHAGPVTVAFPGGEAVDFGTVGDDAEIAFSNLLSDSVSVTVETMSAAGVLPLARALRDADNPLLYRYEAMPAALALDVPSGTSSTALRLNVRREQMNETEQRTLLRITTGAGTVVWLPVSARREDVTGETGGQ
ncbi:MAG: hypothetical protein HN742_17450 [Lentisphaerae bacterium]|nr:hypothetical protein [Lentisphaerota bacterium]MBT7843668.1 hypothetical protein [Lentisphaerota bacterium]